MPLTIQPTTFKYKNSSGVYQSASCISGEAITKTISGTTPTIVADTNTRYVCGELSTLNFTPCASGICDILFTSGSSATLLTVPNTIKWPEWFNPLALATNTTYELNILNGEYGTVGLWT